MNSDAFIPVGDVLRQFLANPMIKASDLKQILQSRGCFSSSNDKKVLGPLLIKTGIAPYEFEQLKETVKEKEDNPKIQTKQLQWDETQEKTLVQALGFNFDFNNLINDPFGVLTIENSPQFRAAGNAKDPNHVIAEIKLKRRDKTKNFGDDESYFECQIELKVDASNNLDLNITTKHTSKESLYVANEVVRRATKALKDASLIKSDNIKRILFTDFTNIGRINFLKALIQSTKVEVYPSKKNTRRIHIQPDDTVTKTRPKEIDFLEKKINDLTLKGSNLDSSVFLSKNELKEHLKLYSVQGSYEIKTTMHEGTCDLVFEFPIYDSMNTSELQIYIANFNVSGKLSQKSKKELKTFVLKTFEEKKFSLFSQHKI